MSKATERVCVRLALFVLVLTGLLTGAFAQEPVTPFFTSGNLVVSVEGNGVEGGTGSYGDNQAAPLTLFQFQLNTTSPTGAAATYVDSLVLPQTGSGANVTVSGEYGSSSEGTINLAGTGQYLTIMGYGVNAAAFNANPTLYGIPGGELGQSGSLTGQSYTPVPRVTALIDPYGNVNSSTAIFNIFNANNPRSTYTADGTHIYVSGQGTSGDSTGGVFFTTIGSSSATTITGDDAGGSASQDTRDVQIYNNTLFISMDSKSGSNNRSYIGTLGSPPYTSTYSCATAPGGICPTGYTNGPSEMSGFGNTGGTGKVTITSGSNSNGNSLNNTGLAINISPENYFFASPSVLYVADSGSPKNNSNADTICTNDGGTGSVGNGGLQKWVNSQSNGTGTWSLAYTLYKGLNLVLNTACDPNDTDGTTGLIGLTGVVVGGNVELFATNYTIADLDPTYVYGVTDTLSYTTASQASSETFTQLATAPADSNFKGIAFAPTLPAGSATITSSPSGLAFTSAGAGCAPGTYTTPVTLIWTPGNSCALSVVSPQTANGTQYSLLHWQDGTTGTTDTVTAPSSSAVYSATFAAPTSISVTSVSPAAEDYGLDAPVTITGVLSWSGSGPVPTASDVTIGGNGPSSYGVTTCGAPIGTTLSCTTTYTPTTLDVPAAYTETAAFSGDSNYSASNSAQTNNFAINQASAGTVVTSSLSPSVYGQSVTFTATINGENNQLRQRPGRRGVKQIVTGTVAWSANTGCGTTAVSSGNPGIATCTTTTVPAGSNTVTATYSGDSNHVGSSGSFNQVVNQATTSISVTIVNPTSEDYAADAPVSITAVLSWLGSGATPTASDVTISGNGAGSYGATSCGTATGNTLTCSATYTPTTGDTPGSYTETAAFAGDTNYASSASTQTNNFAINQASSTTAVSTSLSPTAYGQSVTFTATISGEFNFAKRSGKKGVRGQDVTGTVLWSANTGCGTTTVSSGNPGTATCTTSSLGVGNDAITAAYSGDSNHGASTGTLSGGQVVNQAATSISVSVSPSTEAYGQLYPVGITAVLSWSGSGSAPTASAVTIAGNGNGSYSATSCGTASGDTITCSSTYTPSTSDVPGSYTETATFAGDGNYTGSSSPQTNNFTITQATSTTSVTSSLNPSNFGQSVTFTATISGEFNFTKSGRRGAIQKDVTGTVAWSANTNCGTTTVSSGNPGTATCTTTALAGGSNTVTATYSGDSNHSGSAGTLNQGVNPLNQTITFSQNAPASEVYNGSFTVAASASSGLAVTYGSSGSCSNMGATYTMTSGTGTCSVIASQAGNSDYSAATTVTQTVSATKASQSITVTTRAPASAIYGSSFTIVASASSGLPLTYTASGVCSSNGSGSYTMTAGTGTCTEKLSQAGNGNYTAATTINETTTATEATQTVNFTGAPGSAAYGSTFTVTATSNAPITPIITTSPACTINGDTVTMTAASGTCTLTATWDGNGNYKLATATQSTTATKATPTITWATPSPINYGVALSTTQLDATSSVGGTFKYTPASGVLTAGTHTLSVTFTPTSKTDYNSVTTTVSLQVLQDSTATTITSGNANITLSRSGSASTTVKFNVSSYKPTGAVAVAASSGESCTADPSATTGDGSCKLTFTSAGTRTVTASYPGDANHTGSSSSPVTVVVNPN